MGGGKPAPAEDGLWMLLAGRMLLGTSSCLLWGDTGLRDVATHPLAPGTATLGNAARAETLGTPKRDEFYQKN